MSARPADPSDEVRVARRSYGWLLVAAFAVTTTAGYGVLGYVFAVFLVPMQQALHAEPAAVTLAQTLSILTSAAFAVPAGRWLDRHGGRGLMIGCSVLATALVFAWSRVENLFQLYAVMIGLGIASAGVLYEAAFAVLVTWFRDRRRSTALLAVTIVGGFASTIFLPLTGFLVDSYGWRQALVVLAICYGVLSIPLHLLVRRPPRAAPQADVDSAEAPRKPEVERRAVLRGALRDRAYWLIVVAFFLQAMATSTVTTHLVAYLGDLGHATRFAAGFAGLLGIFSVTGRLITTAANRRLKLTSVVAAVFVVQGIGACLLPTIGGLVGGAISAVVMVGLGFGVVTIARPTLLAERYGTIVFATLAGLQGAVLMIAKAFTPLGAALIRTSTGSYAPVMWGCAVCFVLSAVAIASVGRLKQAQS